MDGVIVGDWEYVWAAWGLSLSMFGAYCIVTSVRLKKAQEERT